MDGDNYLALTRQQVIIWTNYGYITGVYLRRNFGSGIGFPPCDVFTLLSGNNNAWAKKMFVFLLEN